MDINKTATLPEEKKNISLEDPGTAERETEEARRAMQEVLTKPGAELSAEMELLLKKKDFESYESRQAFDTKEGRIEKKETNEGAKELIAKHPNVDFSNAAKEAFLHFIYQLDYPSAKTIKKLFPDVDFSEQLEEAVGGDIEQGLVSNTKNLIEAFDLDIKQYEYIAREAIDKYKKSERFSPEIMMNMMEIFGIFPTIEDEDAEDGINLAA